MSVNQINTIQDVYDKIKEGSKLSDKFAYSDKLKTKNKVVSLSLGRIWFNLLLPEDYPLVDKALKRKDQNAIVEDIFNKYGSSTACDIVSKIHDEGFKLTTLCPSSLEIDCLVIPPELEEEKQQLYKDAPNLSINEYDERANAIAKKLVDHIESLGIEIQDVLNSGAKGDPIGDWKVLLVTRGYQMSIENKVIGPITPGTADGYSKLDYYNAADASRRGFFYKSIMAHKPGYMARKIIMSSSNISLSKTKDCKSKKYFELKVTPEISKSIIGRYYLEGNKLEEITEDNIKSLVNKSIKMRSPLFCKAEDGICPICYGKLAEKLNSTEIGVLAGGAVNQVGINSMMKLRHVAKQFEIVEVDFPKIIKKTELEDSALLKEYLDIQKNKIIAKKGVTIFIDEQQYNSDSFTDTGTDIIVPGIIDIFYDVDNNKYFSLPFNFDVQINKTVDTTNDAHIYRINYTAGDLILFQDSYLKSVNPGLIDKLFDGGAKYITKPEQLTLTISEQLPGVDLCHIELIVSNMFRDADDNTKLCRHVGYQNSVIIGQKQLPFINSWLTGLAFEQPNKAIKNGLLTGQDIKETRLEKILLEKSGDSDE